jgi:hypothetical protein
MGTGRFTGIFFPGINDCNDMMRDAVEAAGGDWNSAYQEYLDRNENYNSHIKDSMEKLEKYMDIARGFQLGY